MRTAEIRTRRLTGRTQIHPSGAQILDGVIFGRPLLKTPVRPAITIPSRRRLGYSNPQTHPDDEDEDDDSDFEDAEDDEEERAEPHTLSLFERITIGHESERIGDTAGESEDDEEDDDEEYPAGTVITVQGARLRRSGRLAGDNDPAENESVQWSDEEEQLLLENGGDDDSSLLSTDEDDYDSGDDQAALEPPRKRTKITSDTESTFPVATAPAPPTVPPGSGKKHTKSRNKRRSLTKKLNFLKSKGELPEEATNKDLIDYLASKGEQKEPAVLAPINNILDVNSDESSSESESESSLSSSSDSDSDTDTSSDSDSTDSAPSVETTKHERVTAAASNTEFQARRAALLNAIAGGGVEISHGNAVDLSNGASPAAESQDQQRTSKLDVRASQRLLLGALGHRAPRSAAERAALVARLEGKEKPKVNEQLKGHSDLNGTTNDDSHGPDFWRSHIELSAVECCGEDVQLSEPPYPFYQRWDPSQWISKKRKRKHREYEYTGEDEAYDESAYLDYDDPVENGTGTEGEEFDGFSEDDLPALPADLTTLPLAVEADLVPGDILVFSNLEVSAATNWTPAMSAVRTAKVVNEAVVVGKPLLLQLALRDCPAQNYDEEGNRVFEKFEMEEDQGLEGLLELGFGELVEPRLVSRGNAEA